MDSSSSKITLLNISDKRKETKTDLVAKETTVVIRLNGKRLAALLATPAEVTALACGFILSSGLIKGMEDISTIKEMGKEVEVETKNIMEEINPDEQIFTSGCGKGILIYGSAIEVQNDSKFSLSSDSISLLMKKFQAMSAGFKTTGGLHSAAISDGKAIINFKEDIGRHNAMDKVIGDCLLKGISLRDKLILTSGRISSEIVVKAIRAGIPILISRSAPTDMAINLAQDLGVTLIGFARGKEMNIYTHPTRIKEVVENSLTRQATLIEKIKALKEKKQAIILAHNYQRPEIQDIADFVGDSLDLSRKVAETDARIIVFCGVYFMAEIAKILSPDKTVLLPDSDAGCPMADMITVEELRRLKSEHPHAAVVCYVNTHAVIKAESDICCTSANGVKIVNSISSGTKIIFTPDKYLGDYIAKQTGRELILMNGFCPTHQTITVEGIRKLKEEHPLARVLVHPECSPDVVACSDAAVSTNGMCRYVRESESKEFIIGTETGIIHRLKKENPDKQFYPASKRAVCPNMKLTTLEKVLWALEDEQYKIEVPTEIALPAKGAIERMLSVL